MKKGLDRLRIALGMGLLSTAVLAATRSARAGTTGASGTVVAGDASWIYSNSTYGQSAAPFGDCGTPTRTVDRRGRPLKPEKLVGALLPQGSTSSGCGFGITEASLDSGDLTDAFDGVLVMAVNGTVFKNPDGSIDLNGTTITSDLVNIGGLNTQVQFFFEPTQNAVRALYSFTNTTGGSLPANVLLDNNLGSDSGTVIAATSDGDTTVEPTDNWFASNDSGSDQSVGPDGVPIADPAITWVRFGQGAGVSTNAQPLASPGAFRESYTLNVPAGATQRLMVIVKLSNNVPDSVSAGPALDSLPELQSAGLLAGLSAQQQSELANWSAAVVGGPATPVPTVSAWGRLGLILSLAVGGLAAVRLGTRVNGRAV